MDKYVGEMTYCFDTNNDGKLDAQELKMMVKGQLGEVECEAQFKKLDSQLIESKETFEKLIRMLG